jgi:hypothetical protein
MKELEPKNYFCGIRTIPQIECSYNCTAGFGGNFTILLEDYTMFACGKTETDNQKFYRELLIGIFNQKHETGTMILSF